MPPVRPSAGPSRPYRFPPTVEYSLSNGLRVIAAQLKGLPVVTILASLDAGAEHEETTQAGLAAITSLALLEGTTAEDADALAARCESLGGEMETDAGWPNATCGVTVLGSRLSGALHVIADVLRDPLLPDGGIVRLRQERLAELIQQEAEPRGVADEAFLSAVFPEAARYGLPRRGDSRNVRMLEPDAVRAFHRQLYVPGNTTVLIVGDVDPDRLVEECSPILGGWAGSETGGYVPQPWIGEECQRRVVVVPRPGAPQSEVRIGHASVPRNHRDYHVITVMNAILGGLFNSRINLNLREVHGYTYGAFSSWDWRRWGSIFEVSTAVRSDVTVAAIEEILGEISRIRDAGVSFEELSLARDYLTGVFPIRFETTEAVANAIASRESFLLSRTYFDEYRERIGSITGDDVLRAAREHLHPDNLQIVVVGDAGSFESDLHRFGRIVEHSPLP